MHDLLRTLVAFPTATGNSAAGHQGLTFIADYLQERGLIAAITDHAGYPSLYVSTQNTKTPTVLLAAHLDVVPAPEAMFTMRYNNGNYYGRGVLDMKFAIAAYLQTIDQLQADLPAYDFGLLITTDEESGGRHGTARYVADGCLPKICILPDGGDDWQIQTYSKGFLYLTLTASGTVAHGSRPWLGSSATEDMIETLHVIRTVFPAVMAEDTDTFNLGKIEGGAAVNQVAASARAVIDIRLAETTDRTKLVERIRTICTQRNVELDITLNGATGSFRLDDPMIAPFVRLLEAETDATITGSRTLGSSDARYFAEHNVPCISLYPPGGGHHGPDEWVSAQACDQFQLVLRQYIEQMARTSD